MYLVKYLIFINVRYKNNTIVYGLSTELQYTDTLRSTSSIQLNF